MNLDDLLGKARESMTARTVFAEPCEKDGLTVIPAARVLGGGGGGSGSDRSGRHGDGGGFGMLAKPVGAFVINDGTVTWRPAVDVNRVLGAAVIGAAIVVARLIKSRP